VSDNATAPVKLLHQIVTLIALALAVGHLLWPSLNVATLGVDAPLGK